MNAEQFFKSPVAALPKNRTENDFEVYLTQITDEYLALVDDLEPACPLGSQVLANKPTIVNVTQFVRDAVRQYHLGRPDRAYRLVRLGIRRLNDLQRLISVDIDPANIPLLYRMSVLHPRDLSKGRLFHIPLDMRHKVGRHRYGIPGQGDLAIVGNLS